MSNPPPFVPTTNLNGQFTAVSYAVLEGLVSREVDADLAQTIVQLSQIQTAYQAALQSGGSILSQSLLDYIR